MKIALLFVFTGGRLIGNFWWLGMDSYMMWWCKSNIVYLTLFHLNGVFLDPAEMNLWIISKSVWHRCQYFSYVKKVSYFARGNLQAWVMDQGQRSLGSKSALSSWYLAGGLTSTSSCIFCLSEIRLMSMQFFFTSQKNLTIEFHHNIYFLSIWEDTMYTQSLHVENILYSWVL